ncbi:Bifunctional NAD(P)H-hydrate repair enzyme Nnr [bioreactor metagenome]|uniref:Nicotinamide nucleotide repair protein n=2 Tax=root TaxID=1 RepID=A0A644XG19_9ZZZZ
MYSMNMKSLARASDITKLDEKAQHVAMIPSLCLMESAGLQAYQIWKPRLSKTDRLVFLCGPGNNGGDALVVSRYAFGDGFTNQLLIYTGTRISDSCTRHRSIAQAYGITSLEAEETDFDRLFSELHNAAWIVDGLMGTGLRGPLQGLTASLVETVNRSKARVFSIDVPSGLGDDVPLDGIMIKADLTVTMGLQKRCMFHPATRSKCGTVVCVNPSFPPFLLEQVPSDILLCDRKASLSKLALDEYKNSRAHVGIFGGSVSYTGAARLSAKACFAARAGLVSLYCDPDVYSLAACESPSVMVKIYEGQSLPSYGALLVGPGWGKGREALLSKLFATGQGMVLDADGIRAYASLLARGQRPEHGPLVLTPHVGELGALLEGLFGKEQDIQSPNAFFASLQKAASELHATLIVKSSLVHIVDETGRMVVIEGNNPSLGVAGSGDVLGGIVASLLAKYQNRWLASLEGALIHQEAGRLAQQAYGYYDSETLLAFLGKAVQEAEV